MYMAVCIEAALFAYLTVDGRTQADCWIQLSGRSCISDGKTPLVGKYVTISIDFLIDWCFLSATWSVHSVYQSSYIRVECWWWQDTRESSVFWSMINTASSIPLLDLSDFTALSTIHTIPTYKLIIYKEGLWLMGLRSM